MVLDHICSEVRESGPYSDIVDETSDISRNEQVAICLRYVTDGITKETFIGFHSTKTTECLVLFELLCSVVSNLGLKLEDIVGQCYDGASNMSGKNKGLATRMKECSPKVLYVHCYGHLLNLAIQDTLSEVTVLRNALGILQSLYNFIGASTKRSTIFSDVDVEESETPLTIKSLSVTRWTCRYEAAKAVIGQIPRIIKTLLILADDHDPKTHSDAKSLLTSICDFEFMIGLSILKIILANTSALSSYLQGQTIDVISARRTARDTTETLEGCRSTDSFQLIWQGTVTLGQKIEDLIDGQGFQFKEPKLPRRKRPSKRMQALVGELPETTQCESVEDHFRINTFFNGLDKVITEMSVRFTGKDSDVLCALGNVVMDEFYQILVTESWTEASINLKRAEEESDLEIENLPKRTTWYVYSSYTSLI